MPVEQTYEPPDEVARVLQRRRREALEAGFTLRDANRYAESQVNTQELRDLIARGCPESLLAKILL